MAARWLHLALLLLLLLSVASSSAAACSSVTFSSNRVYAACNDLPRLSSSLHWSYDAAASLLSLAFVAPPPKPEGWVAWAINPAADGGMLGSQALIAFRQPDGKMGVRTYNVTSYESVAASPIDYEATDLAAEYTGGVMRMFGKVKLTAGTTVVRQVWQVGSAVANGVPQVHEFQAENLAAKGTMDLVKGVVAGDSTASARNKNVHGILNAVSWGILLPVGAIFARYLKTFKSADPAWFYLHVSCQIIGYGVGVGGWATGLSLGSKSKGIQYTTHRNIGMALFSLATLQVFALFLRPNKDHKYRFFWNIYHHLVGYTVIVLGIFNVFKGLQILSVDHKWKMSYIIAICTLGGIASWLEVSTWVVVLKRRSGNSTKLYDGPSPNAVQKPLAV